MADGVQPRVGQKLSLLQNTSLQAPLLVSTVAQTAVPIAQTLGSPSTSRKMRIMAGMEHDMPSKPAICHHASTRGDTRGACRSKSRGRCGTPDAAKEAGCSWTMRSEGDGVFGLGEVVPRARVRDM